MRTFPILRRLRFLITTAVAVIGVVLSSVPALAATNSAVPKAFYWGAWKDCGAQHAGQNCAAIYTTAENPNSNTLYAAGDFTAALNAKTGQKVGYDNLMAIDTYNGGLRTTFHKHFFNGTVYALAVDIGRGRLYVGGNFTAVDGSAANYLAAFALSTGARVTGFAASPNGPVHALTYSGSTDLLYLGGKFTAVHRLARTHLAAVSPITGEPATGFVPPAIRWTETSKQNVTDVKTLASGASSSGAPMLYVGGHFDSVGGAAHPGLFRVAEHSGALDGSFTPSVDRFQDDNLFTIDKIEYFAGGIVVGEAGHVNRAYRYNLGGGRVWTLRANGDVQAVAVHGASAYIGGHFTCLENDLGCSTGGTGVPRVHIAALNLGSGSVDPSFAPRMGPTDAPYFLGVWTLRVASAGTLWAGGVFTKVVSGGHTYDRPKLAAFSAR